MVRSDASFRPSRRRERQVGEVIFPESLRPSPASPVIELQNGSALTVGQLSEPLLRYVSKRSGWRREPALLDMLLGGSVGREPPKAGSCGLNSNGMPLQLCVSARRGGGAMVLIGDPWADLEDPRVRQ